MSRPTWSAGSEHTRWLAPASAFAIIALGRALQIMDGLLEPTAVLWITAALLAAVASIVIPRSPASARFDARLVPLLGGVGLLANVLQLYTKPPVLVVSLPPDLLAAFNWRLAVLTIAAGSTVLASKRVPKAVAIGALVAAHCVIGVWIIHRLPAPVIDVHVFQRDAVAALRHGANPYSLTYPNIYKDASFYGPGLSVNGRLQFGFPYFPLSLLLAMPGQVLAGDHRYSQLVAMELAAILMAFSWKKGFGATAAALFLTTPRVFFVLEQAWTEPFVVLAVAIVVFAACRCPRAVPWAFGAFLAIKQYAVLALPAALLLAPRADVPRFLTKAAIVATAVTLPFMLWNPTDFWNSVVTLQFHQPFRTESLSYLAWWVRQGHRPPSELLSFVAAGAGSGLALWRAPRTAAGFAATLALTFFAFFAFNKQAFSNYYFFVIGTFAATLAACVPSEGR